jgi:hypothetical protein
VAWVIEAKFIVTLLLPMIDTELSTTSVPEVPTVNPDTITVALESTILAAAAVPEFDAATVLGKLLKVRTPLETVPQGSSKI